MTLAPELLEVLGGTDLDAIEAALLDLWREVPDPALGDLFEQFCAYAESVRGPTLSAVLKRARKGSSDAVAGRLAGLFDVHGPDPRLTLFASGLLTNPPAKRHAELHAEAFRLLERNRDRRGLRVLDVLLPASPWGFEYRDGRMVRVKDGFDRVFNPRLEHLAEAAEHWPDATLPIEERSELTRLIGAVVERVVEARRREGIPAPLIELFEQICTEPRNLGLRQVFSDRALELGHADWGEFVALQLRDAVEPLPGAGQRRMRQLLEANRGTWLGAMDGVTLKRSVELVNGFPRAATIKGASNKRILASIDALGWRTLEELTVLTPHLGWVEVMAGVRAFRRLRGDLVHQLPEITAELGRRIRSLDLCFGEPAGAVPVGEISLPNLRELRLTPRDVGVFTAVVGQLSKPLRRLHFQVDGRRWIDQPQYLLHPDRALAWLLERREHCDGRSELAMRLDGVTTLEVHFRRRAGRWQAAIGVGAEVDGLDDLFAAFPTDEIMKVGALGHGTAEVVRRVEEALGVADKG